MGALVLAIVILVYLGRILALVWGVKPLEPADAIFLLPIPLLALAVWWHDARRRRLRRRYDVRVPTSVDRDDWLAGDAGGKEGLREPGGAASSVEEERLREQQEWATARYHWWKQ